MTPLEAAVIERMLADPELNPKRRRLDPYARLRVEERSYSEVGFITSIIRDDSAKLFAHDTAARWGKLVGRLNSKVDVDFVVYVDDGYLDAVEGVTFGGEPWPTAIEEFQLTDLADWRPGTG